MHAGEMAEVKTALLSSMDTQAEILRLLRERHPAAAARSVEEADGCSVATGSPAFLDDAWAARCPANNNNEASTDLCGSEVRPLRV